MMSFSDAIDTASERHMEHILPRKLTEPKNRGLEDVFPSRNVMFRFHISFPGVGCIEIESLHWKKIKIYRLSDTFFFSFNPPKQDRFQKRQGVIWVPRIHISCFYLSLFGRVSGCIIILFWRNLWKPSRKVRMFYQVMVPYYASAHLPAEAVFLQSHGQNETRIVFT